VVLVKGSLREAGDTRCSGIAITPRIVVTNLLCLVLPSELQPSDLDTPLDLASFEGSTFYSGEVDYAASCPAEGGWAPREDGSFAPWLGPPLELSALEVDLSREAQLISSSKVLSVFRSGAASRCWDSLAALVLEEGLDVEPRPVRLTESTQVGEAVVLSAFGPSFRTPLARPAQVEQITFERAAAEAPPHSLLLNQKVCFFEPGGGVLSVETGAVLGVIGYRTGSDCDDPESRTIATRLAPFRRMLLDAAKDSGETLEVETTMAMAAEQGWSSAAPPVAPCP
jgi:hypothetical protein